MGNPLVQVGLLLLAVGFAIGVLRLFLVQRRARSLGVSISIGDLLSLQFREKVDPGAVVEALIVAHRRGALVRMPDLVAALRTGGDPRRIVEQLPVGSGQASSRDDIGSADEARQRLPQIESAIRALETARAHRTGLAGRPVLFLGVFALLGGAYLLAWQLPPLSHFGDPRMADDNRQWGMMLLGLGVACIFVAVVLRSPAARAQEGDMEAEMARLRQLRERCARWLLVAPEPPDRGSRDAAE